MRARLTPCGWKRFCSGAARASHARRCVTPLKNSPRKSGSCCWRRRNLNTEDQDLSFEISRLKRDRLNTDAPNQKNTFRNLQSVMSVQRLGLFIAFVALCLTLSFLSPYFLTQRNLL